MNNHRYVFRLICCGIDDVKMKETYFPYNIRMKTFGIIYENVLYERHGARINPLILVKPHFNALFHDILTDVSLIVIIHFRC